MSLLRKLRKEFLVKSLEQFLEELPNDFSTTATARRVWKRLMIFCLNQTLAIVYGEIDILLCHLYDIFKEILAAIHCWIPYENHNLNFWPNFLRIFYKKLWEPKFTNLQLILILQKGLAKLLNFTQNELRFFHKLLNYFEKT